MNRMTQQELKVSATQIETWSASSRARELLPRLVRRLCFGSGTIDAADMPGGDSINRPGWDGVLRVRDGSAWLPTGQSFWEMSCESKPQTKATSDFKKRTAQTPSEQRAESTFVFVTPRRWAGKANWLSKSNANSEWKDIRVYDADDLEQWLEQTPVTALWMAEQLGLAGPGLLSIDAWWQAWADKSSPSLTHQAILAGRDQEAAALIRAITAPTPRISLDADSAEEAVAFAIAAIVCSADTQAHIANTAIITSVEAWHLIALNPGIKVVIVLDAELLRHASRRADLVVIAPTALSGVRTNRTSTAGPDASHAVVTIRRPTGDVLIAALTTLGVDATQAHRLARNSARSWSVIRRRLSDLPEISVPAWSRHDSVARLAPLLCLLRTWNCRQDRSVIERITGQAYKDVESDLLALSILDDSPVLKHGDVWMTRSPIDVMDSVHSLIPDSAITNFLDVVHEYLAKPDPALELQGEERYKAAILGKKRAESEVGRQSMADSLVQLAVVAPHLSGFDYMALEERVGALIRRLLDGADAQRWLSVSPFLPQFAEAAPGRFLDAVEASLFTGDGAIRGLFSETAASGIFGRCWHAPLLWAMEILAWDSRYFARVAHILFELWGIGTGNYTNSPRNTLLSLLVDWLPHTAAGVDERIRVLDALVARDPSRGWELLVALGIDTPTVLSSNSKPRHRDWGRGAGNGVSGEDRYKMLVALDDRLWSQAATDVGRLVDLLRDIEQRTVARQREYVTRVRSMLSSLDDISRATLRDAIRVTIHRRFRGDLSADLAITVQQLRQLYDDLIPSDLVLADAWLFKNDWPSLPEPERRAYREVEQRLRDYRLKSIESIVGSEGLDGAMRLARAATSPRHVGASLAESSFSRTISTSAIFSTLQGAQIGTPMHGFWAGFATGLEECQRDALLAGVVEALRADTSVAADRAAGILTIFPWGSQTWRAASQLGEVVERAYWSTTPLQWLRQTREDAAFVVARLLEANRPSAAFACVQYDLLHVEPSLLYQVVQQMAVSVEDRVFVPDSHSLSDAFRLMAKDSALDREDLSQLEFLWWNVLDEEYRTESVLFRRVANSPELFCELLAMAWKQPDDESAPIDRHTSDHASSRAYAVLRELNQVPGLSGHREVDHIALTAWIQRAQELADELDLRDVCDSCIGQLLAHTPNLTKSQAVLAALDLPSAERLRDGLSMGIVNRRGMTSRGVFDGGDQERALAQNYRSIAASLHAEFPRVAALFEDLAQYYESEAKRFDLDAAMRQDL